MNSLHQPVLLKDMFTGGPKLKSISIKSFGVNLQCITIDSAELVAGRNPNSKTQNQESVSEFGTDLNDTIHF